MCEEAAPPLYLPYISRISPYISQAATCEEAALVVIEPPDLWNIWWLLTEA